MARLTWLPDCLRAAGLTVDVLPGWSTRGRADINPQAVVCHHTATGPSWPDTRVDHLLRDGRSDLAGPLSQLGLRRDGSFVIVAAGRANHNGYGKWGNDSIGIEAYNDGVREPWPDVQIDAFTRGCAAILARQGWGVDRCLGHKETDPKRKIDPTFDMAAFRRRVAGRLATPPPPQEDDDMPPTLAWLRETPGSDRARHCYRISANTASWCPTLESIDAARFLGAVWWGGTDKTARLDPVIWSSLAILNGPLANLAVGS